MTNADDMFTAARQFAEVIVEQRRAHRAAVRDATNARRRARYASRPKPVRTKPAATVEYEPEPPTECYCPSINYPPCGWCEHSGDEEGTAA